MKKNKLFWPWQDIYEEQWLNNQSENGLALKSIRFPFTYFFDQNKTKNRFYRLDFNDPKKEDLKEYMFTRNEEGWVFIGMMHGWHYFVNDNPGINLTQDDSFGKHKKQKYTRLISFFIRFLPIIIIWFPLLSTSLSFPLFELAAIFAVFAGIIYLWFTIKIYQRTAQLRKQYQ